MIRGSQSISDLTNAIEPNSDSRLSEHNGAISAQGFATPASRPPSTEPTNDSTLNDAINTSTSSSNGLRRVCSLSDLTKHSSGRRMLPAPPLTDVVHEPLDWKLVEQTNMALQQASDNLVQLYKNFLRSFIAREYEDTILTKTCHHSRYCPTNSTANQPRVSIYSTKQYDKGKCC